MANGFNQEFLESNLKRKMRENFERKRAANACIRIMRDGECCFEYFDGCADLEKQTPLTSKSIYRMYSMSKPVTMTALMQLYERGLVYPEDTLDTFFPEFKDMKVAVEREDGTVDYVKQERPITIKHLYTMTSGISYPGDEDAGARAVASIYANHPNEDYDVITGTKWLAKEAALSFQPGAKWKYGFSHDVIGAVISKVSGMTLGEYMKRNIFDPLGMEDTGFYVPAEKHDRFVTAYDYEGGEYVSLADNPEFTQEYLAPNMFESGGGGLVSTLDDYSRFCEMLLGGGEYKGVRILGRKTVEMMSTNQINREQTKTFSWHDRGYGYGVGMRVHMRPWLINGTEGEFGWDGFMGTWMAVDPGEGMTVVYLQNMVPYNDNGMRLMPIIYSAMD